MYSAQSRPKSGVNVGLVWISARVRDTVDSPRARLGASPVSVLLGQFRWV